jgi:hypothetical protein
MDPLKEEYLKIVKKIDEMKIGELEFKYKLPKEAVPFFKELKELLTVGIRIIDITEEDGESFLNISWYCD